MDDAENKTWNISGLVAGNSDDKFGDKATEENLLGKRRFENSGNC